MFITPPVATVVVLLSALLWRILQSGKRDPRMPPGPPTLPLIGNAHLIPNRGFHKKFPAWAKKYGKVFSLKIGSSNMIVLCDRKSVHKLLVERGRIYSDRPPNWVMGFISRNHHLIIENLDSAGRLKRKIISQHFSPKEMDSRHYKTQSAESAVLVRNFLHNPEGFMTEIRRYTVSSISAITWGHRAPDVKSPWYYRTNDLLEKWFDAVAPGANPPVENFPFLEWIPASMAGWRRRAIAIRDQMDETYGDCRRQVNERRQLGDNRSSIADILLDEYEVKGWPRELSQHAFNNLMGEIIEGGVDTTVAQLSSLVLALALHPDVQKRAWTEIDAVCGTQRSPDWSDFNKLPYVNAVVKEAARWRPNAGTSLPRTNTQDDIYDGMLIPKGSTIIQTISAIQEDPDFYDNAEKFDPDRYLNHPGLANEYAASSDWDHRDHYIYGTGRRICPGIHSAERSMWRVTAKLLWAFEISEPVDPITQEVQHLDPNAYTSGVVLCPLPFNISLKARSQAHRETIEREFLEASEELKKFE
ncbi:hypothetical protein INS49_014230 [Diaporthe citri]|uniref:uncharacterized protein n=1 Tax=Diaporthe citri TaxID=83186 RepID=UPI001C7EEDF4|nr:uncharacterized protein INS49_014230 [Diaporthe citri]KAG6358346.1 hypothetical protein INS49_014230 [Diaporthe citri]